MSAPAIVGLTGGIGSGKSTVSYVVGESALLVEAAVPVDLALEADDGRHVETFHRACLQRWR